jgi:hypothetical protein
MPTAVPSQPPFSLSVLQFQGERRNQWVSQKTGGNRSAIGCSTESGKLVDLFGHIYVNSRCPGSDVGERPSFQLRCGRQLEHVTRYARVVKWQDVWMLEVGGDLDRSGLQPGEREV